MKLIDFLNKGSDMRIERCPTTPIFDFFLFTLFIVFVVSFCVVYVSLFCEVVVLFVLPLLRVSLLVFSGSEVASQSVVTPYLISGLIIALFLSLVLYVFYRFIDRYVLGGMFESIIQFSDHGFLYRSTNPFEGIEVIKW